MSGPKRTEPSVHLYQKHEYVNAASTDIKARFDRVREELARQTRPANVKQINQRNSR